METETDVRVAILNSFLTTPHRKLAELAPLHADALARDPLFYAHLAPWYFARGEVRDHKTLFVAHLATCDFPEFRGAAWVLLQQLAPYEVARVLDHATRACHKVPRSLKGAIRAYLRAREDNPRQFDGAALRMGRDLKHLYAALHLRPGPRAEAILFRGEPPEGSPALALKQLARAEDPAEQARIILSAGLPYPTAVGAAKSVTPALLVALVEAMSPQEVINAVKSLKRRGAFEHPELKAMIDAKLAAAKTDKRVSSLKVKKAAASVALDAATEAKLVEVADARIAAKEEIRRKTALCVDKSSSMTAGIEIARQLAALVGAVTRPGALSVYAFDTATFPLTVEGVTEGERPKLSDWERAFRFLRASGSTALGAPLVRMQKDGVMVEQIVIVTDEQETSGPRFVDAYQEYARVMSVRPAVHLVVVGAPDADFEQELRRAGIEFSSHRTEGSDSYSWPNLLPLLSAPSRADLVELIMTTPLPVRPSDQARPGSRGAEVRA